MLLRLIYISIVLLLTSCLFSNDNEGKFIKISPSYTFHIYTSGNQLLYKKDKRMEVSEVLEKNLDSIGWNENYIVTFSKGIYSCFSQRPVLPEISPSTERDTIFNSDLVRSIALISSKYYKSLGE